MSEFTQTTEATIKELEKEIEAKQSELNNLKYADYEAAKEEYALAQQNYQIAHEALMISKNKYISEMNKKIKDRATTYFFGGRGF